MYRRISKPITDYLRDMGVPPRYADILLRTSSQEIFVPKFPKVMADFYGWIPEIEEWLIAKCDTANERQMIRSRGTIPTVLWVNLREACIQVSVTGERAKRLTQYLPLSGRK